MKRIIVSIIILFATSRISAQTIDSIPHHNLGPHSGQTSTFMEMSDGSLLGGIVMADEYPYFVSLGYLLHKVSRHDSLLSVSDTLFLPYEYLPWHLTEKDPKGEGNILAEFYNNLDSGGCQLKIRCFDDNLNIDTTEINVPLAGFFGKTCDPIADPNGDIVLSYYDYTATPTEYHFARIGLDGSIKHQKSNDSLGIQQERKKYLSVFSESPLRYWFWGVFKEELKESAAYRDHVYCYLLDSLFNVTNLYVLPRMSGSPDNVDYENDSYHTKLLSLDSDVFLVARTYNRSYNLYPHIEDDGVMLIKYDSDFNQLAQRKFLSEPYYQYSSFGARPIGLEKSKDGYIYFAYFTHKRFKQSQVSVVKMDSDLNIIWQRHCLDSQYGRDYGMMLVLDDNSVGIMGTITFDETGLIDHTEAFYLIVNDDYDNLDEQGIIIRPYLFYPNPAQDQLYLQYSPDVQPTQVELYDLQGRLVYTQGNGLENINLQGLSAGQYLMKVTLENGKVFTDKMIKE